MIRFRKWYREHPNLVAFVLFGLAVFSAVAWQNHLGQQRKQQICYAEIEDRLLWKDTIDYLGGNNPNPQNIDSLSPELQKLVKESQQRSETFYRFMRNKIDIPPTICNNTGITEEEVRADQIRKGQRPADVTTTTAAK